ncbi:unnamed protein product [Gemmata massiliana]|uniref:Uncharacterized protein n=1 Tax=Gemmata massiliana TaxID=1210884 RepID=A0A6P2D565_9BACT|nr:unnamed protein product [Gemmata massiliana]
MSSRFLAWYTCGVLLITSVAVSAITILPGGESWIRMIFTVLGATAGIFAILGAALLWLPRDHWCNRSRRVRQVLSGGAVVASLLLLVII